MVDPAQQLAGDVFSKLKRKNNQSKLAPLIELDEQQQSIRDIVQQDVFNITPDFEKLCYNKGPWQRIRSCNKVLKNWKKHGILDLKNRQYARPGMFDKFETYSVKTLQNTHYLYIGQVDIVHQ